MRLGPVGPSGAPVGHGPRASNNLFRGTCLKKIKKPRCRGFGWVKRALLGHLVGPWRAQWVPVGPGGPGGMFIVYLLNVYLHPQQDVGKDFSLHHNRPSSDHISDPHQTITDPHQIMSDPPRTITDPHQTMTDPHRSISG